MRNQSISNKRLQVALAIVMIAVAVPGYATPKSAGLTWFQRAGDVVANIFRSKKQADQQAEKVGITTDPKKLERDAMTEGADKNKVWRPGEMLESQNAKLYDQAFLDEQDEFIGREDKLNAAMTRLLTGNKPNLLITGEAGSGKTSLVRGLARELHALYENGGMKNFGKPKIFEIDINSLVAGTKFRGETEAKVKALMDDLRAEAQKKVWNEKTKEWEPQFIVLYLDEVHQLMAAGKTEGSAGIADQFKTFLADQSLHGRVRVIGSTTETEAQILLKDPAIERRFGGTLRLLSPEKAEAVEMIMGNIGRYEAYYGVKFTRELVEKAVDLASDYIPKLVLPDPALDLIHGAAAGAMMRQAGSREVADLRARRKILDGQFNQQNSRKTAAGYSEAARLKQEIDSIDQKIEIAQMKWLNLNRELNETLVANQELTAKIKLLKGDHAREVLAANGYDLERIARNEDLEEQIKILTGQLEKQRNEIAAKRKLLINVSDSVTITIDDILQATADRTGMQIEVLRRTPEQVNRALNGPVARAAPGQRPAIGQVGHVLQQGLRNIVRVNSTRPRGVFTLIDSSNQVTDVVKAIDTFVYGARNSSEVREAHLQTLVIDFSEVRYRGSVAWEKMKDLLAQRPHQAIAFLNVEMATEASRARLIEIAGTGRIQIGDFSDERNFVNFSDAAVFFHFGSVKASAEANFDGTLQERSEKFVEAIRKKFPPTDEGGTSSVAMFAHSMNRLSHTLIHLGEPQGRAFVRIWGNRLKELNTHYQKKLSKQLGVHIERQALVLLSRKVRSLEEVDLAMAQLIHEIDAASARGDLIAGDVINIKGLRGITAEAGEKRSDRTIDWGILRNN